MKILGIDPGSRNLGYCIIEFDGVNFSFCEAGLLKIKSSILQEQIVELVEGIDVILRSHKIDEVAIEDIFYAYNPKTSYNFV